MNAKYFETSALTRQGINEAFEELFKEVYERYKIKNIKPNYIILSKLLPLNKYSSY